MFVLAQCDQGIATIAETSDNGPCFFKSSSAIETALIFEPESTVFATIATYAIICLQINDVSQTANCFLSTDVETAKQRWKVSAPYPGLIL
jgi:hypothetical protein